MLIRMRSYAGIVFDLCLVAVLFCGLIDKMSQELSREFNEDIERTNHFRMAGWMRKMAEAN